MRSNNGLIGCIAENGAIGAYPYSQMPDTVKYTAGFTICSNASLAFGSSAVSYGCYREKSGRVYIFDQYQDETVCIPFLFDTTLASASSFASAAVARRTPDVRA